MSIQINSPKVLEMLTRGMIREANRLLGRPYMINALVVHGNHLGRELGFPTANLKLPDNQPFLLAYGVYAVTVENNHLIYNGMCNIGVRPTVDGKNLSIEVNLFDFSGDLYGKILMISFIDRIRDEIKFNGLDELVLQLQLDKKQALRLLS